MGDGVKKQTDRRRTEAKVLPAHEALSLISTNPLAAADFADGTVPEWREESVTSDERTLQVSDRQRLLRDLPGLWARRRRR
jgi:hypothetical protein